jgi:hypothetical protein
VFEAVEEMLHSWSLDARGNVAAAALLAVAAKLDGARLSRTAQSAMAVAQLTRELHARLAGLELVAAADGAALGSLRGEEAVLVALEMGLPDAERVRIARFDRLEAIRTHRARRLGRVEYDSTTGRFLEEAAGRAVSS